MRLYRYGGNKRRATFMEQPRGDGWGRVNRSQFMVIGQARDDGNGLKLAEEGDDGETYWVALTNSDRTAVILGLIREMPEADAKAIVEIFRRNKILSPPANKEPAAAAEPAPTPEPQPAPAAADAPLRPRGTPGLLPASTGTAAASSFDDGIVGFGREG